MTHRESAGTVERLAPIIGSWEVEAIFPEGGPGRVAGRAEFEPILEGQFVLQRATMDGVVPNSTAIISAHPDSGTFTQHYFDSRGVVRLYAMTFAGLRWTLLRVSPDHSPLNFSQRFLSQVAEDGKSIRGAWEESDDGDDWRHDFALTYVKIGS